jgi:flagella basal body P-ring formation protein FlgA
VLPQLVLLNVATDIVPAAAAPKAAPIVRAGAALHADWRNSTLHAQLPVIALEAGAAGDEIRVRIAHTNRILHARILSAHNVSIIAAKA